MSASAQESAHAPSAAARALAGWDGATGIWFPDLARKDEYLEKTTAFLGEIRAAFEADPDLEPEVLALVQDPARQPDDSSLSQLVRQRRTMFQMLLIGLRDAREESSRRAERVSAKSKELSLAFDSVGADGLELAERRRRHDELWQLFGDGRVEERAALRGEKGLEMIALAPNRETGLWLFMRFGSGGSAAFKEHLDALRTEVERRSGASTAEQRRWRLCGVWISFWRGDHADARRRLREALAATPSEELGNEPLVLALLDRISGDGATFADASTRCKVSEALRENDGTSLSVCDGLLFDLSDRSIRLLGRESSPVFVEILAEWIRRHPTNWPWRLEAIHRMREAGAPRARSEAEAMLAIPATLMPLAARLDAVTILARIAWEAKDYDGALGRYDQFLAMVRFRGTSFPSNGWARLREIPAEEDGGVPSDPGTNWSLFTWVLGRRVEVAIEKGDAGAARRYLEIHLGACLAALDAETRGAEELRSKLVTAEMPDESRAEAEAWMKEAGRVGPAAARNEARGARWLLAEIARRERGAGRRAEALRIAGYLLARPDAEGPYAFWLTQLRKEFEVELPDQAIPSASSPWDAIPVKRPR